MNAVADFEESVGMYFAVMDFSEKMDLVNGRYKVWLVAEDPSRANTQNEWELGSLDVWFKDGSYQANNQGIHSSYLLKEEIVS